MTDAADGGRGDADGDCPEGLDACLCTAGGVFDLLSRRHAMPILCAVESHGGLRYGAIQDHLPAASSSTLSTRLEELADAGLLDREQYDEIPPRVEYSLTDEGEELGDRLEAVVAWARDRGD